MAKTKKVTFGSEAPSGSTSLDVDALKRIVDLLESSEVTRLVWTNGHEKLMIRRGQPPAPLAPVTYAAPIVQPVAASPTPRASAPRSAPVAVAAAPAPAAAPEKKGHVITSPFVGTFYRAPSPDQAPFTEVGALVRKGQVLCIIEAMKLMNEIEAEVAGKVTEILVQNAQSVEFGQPLFRVEPA